ncbi:hypothetical protein ACQWHW_25185, partial [Salmonella enterica subsp. enterica serovar Infantis]
HIHQHQDNVIQLHEASELEECDPQPNVKEHHGQIFKKRKPPKQKITLITRNIINHHQNSPY